ncbi:MAG: phosphate ABC transporter permease subunit PstC, partial [Hyphomicrobiales bacterium]|nr:phosphate ABC transporter permease subunit PstC [Hyphomicrobiales bacterium]
MPTGLILLVLIVSALLAYFIGIATVRSRMRLAAAGTKMHSTRTYYGGYLALWTLLPAIIAIVIWSSVSPFVIQRTLNGYLPEAVLSQSAGQRSLTLSRISDISEGIGRMDEAGRKQIERARLGLATMDEAKSVLQKAGVAMGSAPEPFLIRAAYDRLHFQNRSQWGLTALSLILLAAGFLYGFRTIHPRLRARNYVETAIIWSLIAASAVAILTTLGIIWSMLFETIKFFQSVSPSNFFFGTVWDPRFAAADGARAEGGQFGLLPLAWGTIFISMVALAVAVPVGLFAAIYMSEYATKRIRDIVKPILEILAGIPTIVYGFFALITFGPLLRDAGSAAGLSISANSVLTAGIVMGVMIIPFVSSLSDDIINAVPQSLREGSLGLGATRS